MIETPARVVRVDGRLAWVRVEAPSSCGACAGKGCSSVLFARLLHPREPEYPVDNPIEAEAGEAVVVGIEDGALMRAVLAGYLVPLAMLVAGAVLAMPLGEGYAVAGSLVGLAVAGLWLRRRRATATPVILRRGQPSCAAH